MMKKMRAAARKTDHFRAGSMERLLSHLMERKK